MWKCLSPCLAHSSLLNFVKSLKRVCSPKRGRGRMHQREAMFTVFFHGPRVFSEEPLPVAWHRLDHSPLRSLNDHISLHHMASLYLLDLSHLLPWSQPFMPQNYSSKYPSLMPDLPLGRAHTQNFLHWLITWSHFSHAVLRWFSLVFIWSCFILDCFN